LNARRLLSQAGTTETDLGLMRHRIEGKVLSTRA
jgi:hypothetical protein